MRLIDMTGTVFGKLRVLGCEVTPENRTVWLCQCDCGKKIQVRGPDLRAKRQLSCGCLKSDRLRSRNLTHGETNSAEYRIWLAMRRRCAVDERYVERRITVCEEWALSFDNFLRDMGRRPTAKHSIDRRDNSGNYTKENCRWVTQVVQNNNTRRNIFVEHEGQQITVAEWCRITGLHPQTAYARLRKGYPIDVNQKSGPRPQVP